MESLHYVETRGVSSKEDSKTKSERVPSSHSLFSSTHLSFELVKVLVTMLTTLGT